MGRHVDALYYLEMMQMTIVQRHVCERLGSGVVCVVPSKPYHVIIMTSWWSNNFILEVALLNY